MRIPNHSNVQAASPLILTCSGKFQFAKIIKLIDELIATLKKKQRDNNAKKQWCKAEIDKIEDNKKVLKNKISDSENAIDSAKESIMTLKIDIAAFDDGICALDQEVCEYTEQRKEDDDDCLATLSGNTAAGRSAFTTRLQRLQEEFCCRLSYGHDGSDDAQHPQLSCSSCFFICCALRYAFAAMLVVTPVVSFNFSALFCVAVIRFVSQWCAEFTACLIGV